MANSGLTLLLILVIPWLALILLSSRLDLEKKGFLVAPGILIWRTGAINSFLDRLQNKYRYLHKFSDFSIQAMLTLFFTFPIILIINAILSFTSFAIPLFAPNPIASVNIETILLVLLPLIVSLFIHDLFHALSARAEHVEVERAGIAVIVIFIATFVQMVPASLKKLNKRGHLKILSMGVMANFVIVMLTIPMLAFSGTLVAPLYSESDGALITEVYDNYPAKNAGMSRGQIVVGLQHLSGDRVTSFFEIISANDLIVRLRDIPAGQEFILVLTTGEQRINGVVPPSFADLSTGSYLGIGLYDYRPSRIGNITPFIPYWVEIELKWMININLILSVVNLLPLPLTDGGKIADLLIKDSVKPENRDRVRKSMWFIAGMLLIFNLLVTIF